MRSVGVRELREDLAQFLDEVSERREHLVVTRRGKRAVAIVPIDEYESLEETAEILSDPETLSAIEEGLKDFERGDSISLDEIREDMNRRRSGQA